MQTDPDQIADMMAAQDLLVRDVTAQSFERLVPALFAFDAETLRLLSANASARNFMARDLRRLRGRKPWHLFPGLDMQRTKRVIDRIMRRRSRRAVVTVTASDDPTRHFAVTLIHIPSDTPTVVLSLREVSHYMRYRDAAQQAQTQLMLAINALSDGFVIYDADDRMILCNDTYRQIYSDSAAAMVPGNTFEDILRYGLDRGQYADAIGREEDWLAERLRDHRGADCDVEQLLSDGTWLRIVERKTPDGGRVGLRVNITALKEQQMQLSRMVQTDDLTGLRNRHNLDHELAALAAQRKQGERVVLMHLDLDRFKVVNGVFGHQAGDFVLRTCAEILASGPLRPRIAARVGGDEFLMAYVTRKSTQELRRFANRLIARISEPISFDGHLCHVGASIGLACVQAGTADAAADAMTGAAIALSHAKRNPIEGVVVFKQEMRENTVRNSDMAQQMQAGLLAGEFLPFFQPQINARTGDITGFEALIRWIRSDGTTVPADQFLAVAQNAGLTDAIDDIVMDHSCRAVRKLMDWGVTKPCVSLNMSMAQISDSNLVHRLTLYMRRHGVSHDNLRIELLESTLLEEGAAHIVANVHAMIAAGFRVELDDFGTGHAAIATLRKFDVSQIKIDRSLVRHIDQDNELQTITGAIVDLAQNLGISVLAEGVETQAEQDMLLNLDCETAQGYLHAKPMPLSELRTFIAGRSNTPLH